jgi:hypothetical protein
MHTFGSKITTGHPRWKTLPDPPHLRYCAAHRLLAWQPHRVLDARLLARIDLWLLATENVSPPCKRFIDFSRLTSVALPIGHAFTVVPATVDKSGADAPIKCALFCDKPIGFAIARLYETLTTTSSIEVRAFRDRVAAARWLGVPTHVLNLADTSAPNHWRAADRLHERYAAF